MARYFGSFFRIFLCLLLVVMLFRVLTDSEVPTLYSVLDYLQSVPSVDVSWIQDFNFFAQGDWGIFDFMRDIMNALLSVIQVFCYASVGVTNLVVYVAYLVKFIFVGV